MSTGKNLLIILIMLLAFYPILELTRLVLEYEKHYPGYTPVARTEITSMWILYLIIVPLLIWRLKDW